MVLSAPASTYGHQRPVAGPPTSGFTVHSRWVHFPFLGLVQAISSAYSGLLTRPWSSKAQRACLESQQCPPSSQPMGRSSSDTCLDQAIRLHPGSGGSASPSLKPDLSPSAPRVLSPKGLPSLVSVGGSEPIFSPHNSETRSLALPPKRDTGAGAGSQANEALALSRAGLDVKSHLGSFRGWV